MFERSAMRCHSAERLISRRVSGPLSSEDAAALERHLTACPECRREQDRLGSAWSALEGLTVPDDAPDDWSRIEAALEERRRWTPSWWAWEFAVSGAVRAAVLAGMIVIGAGGGAIVARPLLARAPAGSVESTAFAEALGDLPWDSPAAALDRAFEAPRLEGRTR
jgi:anti-sigma factor RsiW